MANPYNLPPDRARAVQEGEALMKDISPVAAPVSPVVRPASPPLRRGALQAPNGQYAGYTYFNPINNSASPVIGAYSPYPTMLFAPRRFDSMAALTSLLNGVYSRPQPNYMPMLFSMMQQMARNMRPRGTGAGAKPAAPAAPVQPNADAFVDNGSWNAYIPGMDMRTDRDSFRLRQSGPDSRDVKPQTSSDKMWWQTGDLWWQKPADITGEPITPEERRMIEQQQEEIAQGGERRALTDNDKSNTRRTIRGGRIVEESIRPKQTMPWWGWQLFPKQDFYRR